MERLTLPVPAALLVFACTAGTGTPGTGTGSDPAPTSGERPPSSTEHPGSSTDPWGCLTCQGSFVCGSGQGQFEVDLTEEDGVCYVTQVADRESFDRCTGLISSCCAGSTVKPSSDGIQICVVDTTTVIDSDGGGVRSTRSQCTDCPAGTTGR
jgi:hypothetical protein